MQKQAVVALFDVSWASNDAWRFLTAPDPGITLEPAERPTKKSLEEAHAERG
jgi:hypothetical protein